MMKQPEINMPVVMHVVELRRCSEQAKLKMEIEQFDK